MCVITGDATLADWKVWSDHPLRKEYVVLVDLGEGAFSSVVLGKHVKTGAYAALKVVYLENPEVDPEHLDIMKREAEFLCMLDHPNIVECTDVVDNGRQQVLVLEYLRGGQLLDHLHTLGDSYSEQQAATIFAQIADAVAYLHEYNIIHRDIKSENFVFAENPALSQAKGIPLRVKLIDLGMSTLYNHDKPIRGALGSPGFVSPEVVADGIHTFAMDVFAMGILLFIMLVGRHPFNVTESENLAYCHLDLLQAPGLQDKRWLSLSPSAKSLVLAMLQYDPDMRITAKEVLAHDWLVTRGGEVARPLGVEVPHGAANLASLRRLRNSTHGVVALETPRDRAQPSKGRSARERFLQSLQQERAAAARTKSHRGDASNRGISRLERLNLSINAKAFGRMHDSGRTVEPQADISQHYRNRGDYHSVHGGSAYYGDPRSGSVRKSGSVVGLDRVIGHPDFSTTPRAIARSRSEAANLFTRLSGRLRRGSSGKLGDDSQRGPSTGAVIKSMLDASRHGRDASRHGRDGSRSLRGDGEGSRRMLSLRRTSPDVSSPLPPSPVKAVGGKGGVAAPLRWRGPWQLIPPPHPPPALPPVAERALGVKGSPASMLEFISSNRCLTSGDVDCKKLGA